MTKQKSESKAMQVQEPPSHDLFFREFDHALHDMERRMDRLMRETFGTDGLQFPIVQGLLLQPTLQGGLQIRPFGHLQETLDQYAERIRQPMASWTLSDDGKDLEVRCEVPGIKKKDLEVNIRADGIDIAGHSGNANYNARIDPGILLDPDTANATYEDGVLVIHCRAKAATAQGSRSIPIG